MIAKNSKYSDDVSITLKSLFETLNSKTCGASKKRSKIVTIEQHKLLLEPVFQQKLNYFFTSVLKILGKFLRKKEVVFDAPEAA